MTEERVQRRLAAILAADMVGFSRLMGLDETGTIARQKAHRKELIDPTITEHNGRIVKTTGDGMLAEFASVVDAVQCAVEVQQAMAEREIDLPDERRIRYRVGVNLGDIVIDGDDILGDGVNVAARLEALAEPGSICISDDAYRQVRDKLDHVFVDAGEQELKNIARAIKVWRWSGANPTMPSEIGAPALKLPDKPSIAVLPFANMSGDPEQEYFADGIAEDIITALSRFRFFFVIARNSSFTYKGQNVDVRQIGRELGARYVLEGSVRRGGNRLRITAQLIETGTGNHLWAERYDGATEDVFDLQDKIAEGVTAAIEPSVRQAEIERARRKRPENLDAYDLYLRALPHAWAYTQVGSASAGDLLKEALRIDPTYASAHGLAAWCYAVFNRQGGADAESRSTSIRHAHAVLSLDTDDSVALVYAAFAVGLYEGDHGTALAAAQKALALTPNSATVLGLGALIHAFASHWDRAVELAQRSLELSPFDPTRYNTEGALAWARFFTGRYADAVEAAQRAVHANPSFIPGFVVLAASYARLSQMEKARNAIDRLLAVNQAFRIRDFISLPRFAPQELAFLGEALREAGLPE